MNDISSRLGDSLKGSLTQKNKPRPVNPNAGVNYDSEETKIDSQPAEVKAESAKKTLTAKKKADKVRKKKPGHDNITVTFRMKQEAFDRIEARVAKANTKGMDLDFRSVMGYFAYQASKLSNTEFQELVIKSRIDLATDS